MEQDALLEESQDDSWDYDISYQDKLHFILTALLLGVSSCVSVILTPLYIETISIDSDAYFSLLFTFLISSIFLSILSFILHHEHNLPKRNIFTIGLLRSLSSLLIFFAFANKRLMCHIQDPILSLSLTFSFAFYFMFCKKAMGARRIFSSLLIIIGLFVCVDYQLCDEYKCHGNILTPQHISGWEKGTHLLWLFLTAVALALLTYSYTIMENQIIKYKGHFVPESLLATVSRIVDGKMDNNNTNTNKRHVGDDGAAVYSLHTTISLAVDIILTQLITIVLLAWTIQPLGKASSLYDWWVLFTAAIASHFSLSSNVAIYAWIYAFTYSVLLISSIHFIILSESSVFTVACTCISLPVSTIWWSLFTSQNAVLQWSPLLTGELVSALLSIPIISIGFIFLFKSHWTEMKIRQISSPCQAT